MTDTPIMVAEITKNSSEAVRVVLDTFKGHQLVDLRVFATFSAASVPMPTKKGLSVNVALIPDLIEALQQAHEKAVSLGWIGGAE